ncbi:MAG: hypothetical protein LBH90_00740 [Tannerella sp.]|jgi:hypothetical protein|nr:hypothetical protein [Tannerella sp.]
MANKEKLEQLTGYINKLAKLTEDIYEREIYPVSFFSQACDVTNKIQEILHQIEIDQIELFERQMKEHQAQIQTIQQLKTKNGLLKQSTLPPQHAESDSTDNTTQVEDETHSTPVLNNTEENNAEKQTNSHTPIDEKLSFEIEHTDKKKEQNPLPDLRKTLRLNDRFRFCRELFSFNEGLMNRTFSELNSLESYNSSVDYIKEHFNWDLEDEVVSEFMIMLEKRFELQ